MAKIGIMGGTFDPIHLAHLAMARCAMQQKGLDKVLFMPAGSPPHKQEQDISDEALRGKLVQLAIEGEEGFFYSDFELGRGGLTYTVETLEQLSVLHPEDSFYFIMGGDSLFQFEHWYQSEKILKYAVLLVVSREPGLRQRLTDVAAELSVKLSGQVEVLQMEEMNISSSMVRAKIAAGEAVESYLPEKVYEYIRNNHCYQ